MKAIQIVAIGSPLEETVVPDPVPGPGEVVVGVRAAGICHSDAHYRAGTSAVGFTPITPGHEVSGIVVETGPGVHNVAVGDRVALHYLVTCGQCEYCVRGMEQFCLSGKMIGKHAHGGYADFVVVPAQNAIPIPDTVEFETAAVMMCSSATAFHALRRARVSAGDRVAVVGVGGLGMSAVQLARACGAVEVYAVDIDPEKLRQAAGCGAVPVNGAGGDAVRQIRDRTDGKGVDVSIEFAGLPLTQREAVEMLAVHGRAALAGITAKSFEVMSYATVLNREAEILGVSDHLRGELVTLLEFAARGLIDLGDVITERVPLASDNINRVLDSLDHFRGSTRAVIAGEALSVPRTERSQEGVG